MNYRGVGVVVVALILTACGGSSSSGPEPLSIEEYTSELIEVSDPINQLCMVLEAQARTDDNLPALRDCKRDDSVPGNNAITMVWEDPAYNAAMEDLPGQDWIFAPLVAVADLYANDASRMTDVDLLLFFYKDECNNTIEMSPEVALKLGTDEITPMEALEQVDIYGDVGC